MNDRYDRQIWCDRIGKQGQVALGNAKVLLVGCGGLGSSIAESLVRMGIGTLAIIDQDSVEETNLHRQQLYSENDIGMMKATTAKYHLCDINSNVSILAFCTTLSEKNIHQFSGYDLIVDATDNLSTRYLINDTALEWNIPWIYGGVTGTKGMVMPVIPGKTPCLRCLWEEQLKEDKSWLKSGILPSTVTIVAAMQVIEAVKILTGQEVKPELVELDVWTGVTTRILDQKKSDCKCFTKNK